MPTVIRAKWAAVALLLFAAIALGCRLRPPPRVEETAGAPARNADATTPVAIQGVVRTLSGDPIPGARVRAMPLEMSGTSERGAEQLSDSEGGFHVVVASGRYLFVATHASYATGSTRIDTRSLESRRVDLLLVAAGSIAGEVLDRVTGNAVSGASIQVTGELAVGSVSVGWQRPATSTDAHGAFSLDGLRPGTIRLVASRGDLRSRPTFVPLTLGAHASGIRVWVKQDNAISGVAQSGLDVGRAVDDARVEPVDGDSGRDCNAILSGRVSDEGGAPAAEVWIDAGKEVPRTLAVSARQSVLTGADGRFAFAGLCDGPYRLSAHSLQTFGRATKRAVAVGSAVTLALHGPSAVTGTIRSKGNPVGDYACLLMGPSSRRERFQDAGGRFELSWLDPGTHALLIRSNDGFALRVFELAPDVTETVDITLTDWSTLRGHLVDARARPVAGVPVTFYDDADEPQSALKNLLPGVDVLRRTSTDETGAFSFDRLFAGAGVLSFGSVDSERYLRQASGGLGGPRDTLVGFGATLRLELEAGKDMDLGPISIEGNR